jgi:hypothetical protein
MPNGCPVTESVIRICHFYPAVASPVGKYAQIKTHLVQTRQSQDASTVPIRSGDTEAARSLGCKPAASISIMSGFPVTRVHSMQHEATACCNALTGLDTVGFGAAGSTWFSELPVSRI